MVHGMNWDRYQICTHLDIQFSTLRGHLARIRKKTSDFRVKRAERETQDNVERHQARYVEDTIPSEELQNRAKEAEKNEEVAEIKPLVLPSNREETPQPSVPETPEAPKAEEATVSDGRSAVPKFVRLPDNINEEGGGENVFDPFSSSVDANHN